MVSDGHNDRTGPLIWKPKHSGAKAQKTDGDSRTCDHGSNNPAVGPVPSDFVNVGFAAMEHELDTLISGSDSWNIPFGPDSFIAWHDRSILSDRQLSLEAWWGRQQPQLHVAIEPWVMYHMDQSGADFSKGTLIDALDVLSQQGSSKQRSMAAGSANAIKNTRGCFRRETQSYWGVVQRHGDFTDQQLTVACFQFHVIDFGDSIPLAAALMRSTRNAENVERNQCVLLHLADGLFRNESGRKKQAPCRGRVFMLDQELRRVELTNAQLALESLKGDVSLDGTIIRSNAHDATNASRDRDFRTMGFFLSSIIADLKTGRTRIFGIGRGSNGYEVSAHLFPNGGGDDGVCYIDLIAQRHHMRWGKLVNDSRWKEVSDWREHFSSVVHYPVKSWSEFGETTTDAGVMVPAACLYCKKKVEIPAEAPLLQESHHCDGKRRNSMGTEGNQWRISDVGVGPIPNALSWTPGPDTPLSEGDVIHTDALRSLRLRFETACRKRRRSIALRPLADGAETIRRPSLPSALIGGVICQR